MSYTNHTDKCLYISSAETQCFQWRNTVFRLMRHSVPIIRIMIAGQNMTLRKIQSYNIIIYK